MNVLGCLFMVPVVATFVLYAMTFANINRAVKLGLNYKPKPDDEFGIGFGCSDESVRLPLPQTNQVEADDTVAEPKETDESPSLGSKNKKAERLNDLRLALSLCRGLFISFFILTLTITPCIVISVYDFDQRFSTFAHIYPFLLLRLCATVNFIIYPIFHSSFWHGYINVFTSLFNLTARIRQQLRQFFARSLNQIFS